MNVGYPTKRLFDLSVRKLTTAALRIHPVVPANTREAVCDTVLPKGGGEDGESPLFVKAGTQVLYSVYSMHRRKDIFGEDVENFRPERWEDIQPKWVNLLLTVLFQQTASNVFPGIPTFQWWSQNLFRS
jgi:hypothetical protein